MIDYYPYTHVSSTRAAERASADIIVPRYLSFSRRFGASRPISAPPNALDVARIRTILFVEAFQKIKEASYNSVFDIKI